MRNARKGYTMRNLKKLMDDLDRELQYYNDLNDQVLVIEEENEFGEAWENDFSDCLFFDWIANYRLPGRK